MALKHSKEAYIPRDKSVFHPSFSHIKLPRDPEIQAIRTKEAGAPVDIFVAAKHPLTKPGELPKAA